ncbi:MAG TPA: ester cyclase [Dehalococcoidia bacterium]|nr:ester cyclase [Dehalococcoidia bacterium]
MSQARCAQVMRTYLEEAVGKGKLDVIDEFTAPDFIDHSQPDARGPAALKAHAGGFRQNFPDVEIEVLHVIASDDQAVGIWHLKGTQTGELFGVAATNKVLEFTVASVFTFRDEMLVDYFVESGLVQALAQMGVKFEVPAETTAS